ncbi:hypothetical protein B0H66DRAFT_564728 [Apodospora peruviana]|uniref:Uncharacterized protein n=1 Tax=Apodospora peruviana TaxID=516989 RepID=A0AAE0M240_9PEZI|nr:hypothetical protein B0H66DRAFT_564728 [Apodospora peruviana]
MSGRKFLTLGLVVSLGIFNGYYAFAPSIQEEVERSQKQLNMVQTNPVQSQESAVQPSEAPRTDKVDDTKSKKER